MNEKCGRHVYQDDLRKVCVLLRGHTGFCSDWDGDPRAETHVEKPTESEFEEMAAELQRKLDKVEALNKLFIKQRRSISDRIETVKVASYNLIDHLNQHVTVSTIADKEALEHYMDGLTEALDALPKTVVAV